MDSQYNLRSPAVKRLMREAAELRDSTELYYTQPIEDNLFEWHFTVRGPQDTDFAGGIYHGRIILPPEYPMKPPSIMILTPNGRFELNKKICLSISGHHPESWQPSWSIRTALLAIIGFMPSQGAGAIGALDYTPDERKELAKRSLNWKCPSCGAVMKDVLPALTEASQAANAEAKELAQQIVFKDERERKDTASSQGENSDGSSSVNEPDTNSRAETTPPAAAAPAPASAVGNVRPTVQEGRRYVSADIRQRAAEDAAGSTTQLLMIFVVAAMIAALLFRRFFILTEFREPTEL